MDATGLRPLRILLLSPYPEAIRDPIIATGDTLTESNEPPESLSGAPDLIVSYGYRHIMRRAFLEALNRPPINLHISLLPWNRGSDPNIWSWIEDTPKGVTIHEIDEGIDTGDIVAQESILFDDNDTLRTSYDKLRRAVESLFAKRWPDIRSRNYTPIKQTGGGSSHKCADRQIFTFSSGLDTPVAGLSEWAAEIQMSQQFSRRLDSEISR